MVVALVALAGCSSSSGNDTTIATTAAPTTSGASSTTAASGTTTGSGLTLTSSAFDDGGEIPATFACSAAGGDDESPPLSWTGAPEGTETLVLVVHDPDAPVPGGFTHLVTAFAPDTPSFTAAANDSGGPMGEWIPMCPPSGEHRYQFTLYAFGADVAVPAEADKPAIDALAPDALAQTTLTGRFAKP